MLLGAQIPGWQFGNQCPPKQVYMGKMIWRSKINPSDEATALYLVRITAEKNVGKLRPSNNIDYKLAGL